MGSRSNFFCILSSTVLSVNRTKLQHVRYLAGRLEPILLTTKGATPMAQNMTKQEKLENLWDKIKDIRIAMLTTEESDGTLRSRPMYMQQAEFVGDIWFFTRDDSGKVREIMHDKQVNLGYADPDDQRYASVSGPAQVIDDQAKEKELWNPALKAWFPDGLDDPHLSLIKVHAEQAEYWDSPNGKVVQLVGLAKAAVTGEAYEGGENEKVNL